VFGTPHCKGIALPAGYESRTRLHTHTHFFPSPLLIHCEFYLTNRITFNALKEHCYNFKSSTAELI
jgi:hypothetical protein